jgi:two-component system, LytTR family, sensor kinase
MRNLLFPGKSFLVFYGILWLACTLAQFVLFTRQFDLGLQVSALDAIITQTTLFVMLIPLWFVARIQPHGKPMSLTKLGNAFAAGIILLGLWFYAMSGLLYKFVYVVPQNSLFMKESLTFRLVFGSLTAFVVFSSLLAYRMLELARKAGKREAELQRLVQETELQALKNQLNPHFIYNSLNAISSLTLTDPEKAREMVIKLSDFLRYALRQDALQLSSLEQELHAIGLYLQIEKVRFGDRLICKLEVDEQVKGLKLPGLILQPLFENALKHGVQQHSGPSTIEFRAISADNEVVLKVSNFYDPRFARYRGEGVGLENIRNRLRLHYGNGQLLQVTARGNEFTASLSIPGIPKEDHDGPDRNTRTTP